MNEINRVTNCSLIALLLLTMIAYIYIANIMRTNTNINNTGSKIVAAFNA